MKIYYYLMMKYYDSMINGAFSLEDSIFHMNQYLKYKRLFEKR